MRLFLSLFAFVRGVAFVALGLVRMIAVGVAVAAALFILAIGVACEALHEAGADAAARFRIKRP
jgi:hypothetical protein